jgi:hypothetical protein
VGSWTNDAHLSNKNVQELGKLVQVGIAQETADARDAGVIFRRLFGISFRVNVHGPEFQARERTTQEAYPALNEEDGTTGVQFDEYIEDGEQPAEDEQQYQYRNGDIEDPFCEKVLMTVSDIGP